MLSMCGNWLLVGWASAKNWLLVGWTCAKIGYLLAEHARKLVIRWLSLCQNPISPVLCLCSMSPFISSVSHVSVPCLLSAVPSLASLFLVSRPRSPASLSPVLCTVPCLTWSVPCLLSSFLRPLTPINCPSVPFLWLYSTVPVLCSFVYRPLLLQLLSSAPCLSYFENASFSLHL